MTRSVRMIKSQPATAINTELLNMNITHRMCCCYVSNRSCYSFGWRQEKLIRYTKMKLIVCASALIVLSVLVVRCSCFSGFDGLKTLFKIPSLPSYELGWWENRTRLWMHRRSMPMQRRSDANASRVGQSSTTTSGRCKRFDNASWSVQLREATMHLLRRQQWKRIDTGSWSTLEHKFWLTNFCLRFKCSYSNQILYWNKYMVLLDKTTSLLQASNVHLTNNSAIVDTTKRNSVAHCLFYTRRDP